MILDQPEMRHVLKLTVFKTQSQTEDFPLMRKAVFRRDASLGPGDLPSATERSAASDTCAFVIFRCAGFSFVWKSFWACPSLPPHGKCTGQNLWDTGSWNSLACLKRVSVTIWSAFGISYHNSNLVLAHPIW